MMVSGKTIKKMVKEPIPNLIIVNIQENGKMIK